MEEFPSFNFSFQDIEFMVSWRDGKPEFKLGFKREYCKGMDDKQYDDVPSIQLPSVQC